MSYLPNEIRTIAENLIDLIRKYNQTQRATTQPFILAKAQKTCDYTYSPDDELIRETLAEHVGNLPIIATFLYPYLEHSVDIGTVLTMLAIHDIGELSGGDVNTFIKNQTNRDTEYEAALKLIHPSLLPIYEEYEAQHSREAQFAKSVDKMAPDIVDILCPREITFQRFHTQLGKKPEEILPLIKKHKAPYMQWDGFIAALHGQCMNILEEKLYGTSTV
jgi:5'-deoxynucleotidase YfbR-like HD superfamily hydrolase